MAAAHMCRCCWRKCDDAAWSSGVTDPVSVLHVRARETRYTAGVDENTFERHVGRLIEIRHGKGFETVADIEQMQRAAGHVLSTLPAEMRVVTVADWRMTTIMGPEAAERAVEMLLRANPHTERSAMLYSERSPTAVMQFVRLLRDSQHPDRRMFSDPLQLAYWLDEVLDDEESKRLRVFLGIGAGS